MLDVGCGTGTFACLLAAHGLEVFGVDPAQASLDVARAKPGAAAVTWWLGDATTLPPLQVDVATMTGNVAQVFVSDAEWSAALAGVHRAVRPGGWLVLESRDPDAQAWREWTPERSMAQADVEGVGRVRSWVEVTTLDLPRVSFRTTFELPLGEVLTSESTLRFRTRSELEVALTRNGYDVTEVRDAPDRPGRELVLVARRR